MVNYSVHYQKTAKTLALQRERYNCEPHPTAVFEINIDHFISIIKDCENDGIMIRRTMDKLCPILRKSMYPLADIIVGRIAWASSKKLLNNELKCLGDIEVTDKFLKDFGAAIIKCWYVAERFTLPGSDRNDARFRYWVTFKMPEDNYNFGSLVISKYYRDTQYEFAKRGTSLNNVVYFLSLWDKYFDKINIEDIVSFDTYLKNATNTEVYDSLKNALNYLELLRYFISKSYTDIQVINGKPRRITKVFPTEILAYYLQKTQTLMNKLKEVDERFSILLYAKDTLPSETFNFYYCENVIYEIHLLWTTFDCIIYYVTDTNVDFRKVVKMWQQHVLNTFMDTQERYKEMLASKDARVKQCFGYYMWGPRYSRPARQGTDRRPVIFT